VEDVVKLGDTVTVKVLHVDDQGKVGLSIKALIKGSSSDNNASYDQSERPRRHDRGQDKRNFRH